MKVLIITQYFWPENFKINDMALGLKERGYQVEVLTGKPNYPKGDYFAGYSFGSRNEDEYQGIPVIRVPLVRRAKGGKLRLILNYLSFSFFASLWVLFARKLDYQLIFVYQPSPVTVGLPAALLKMRKKIPLLFWVQDLWPESLSDTGYVRNPWILKAVRHMVRWIYKKCNFILVQSRAFFSYIRAYGIEEERIIYFPNNTEEFYRPVALTDNILDPGELPKGFSVLFAGSIGEAQDFETILRAAEQLKEHSDIHWLIFGDGRKKTWVQEQVKSRQLDNVHLLGLRTPEQMPHYFSLADTLLVTLKNDPIFSSTIPAKVQSYLACGRPIIAALDGEGSHVIEVAKAGMVAPAGNPSALAQIVLKMYHLTESERLEMGCRAREYFNNNFDRHLLLDKFDSLVQKATFNQYETVREPLKGGQLS